MRVIRPETSADYDAVRGVNDAAFGCTTASTLVRRLRDDGCIVASLVAEEAGRIVGHILFSDLPIQTACDVLGIAPLPDGHGSERSGTHRAPHVSERSISHRFIPAAALAPLAVHPEWQRQGIGSDLVRAGLLACSASGKAAVIVSGHPDYYRQFGFSPELARGISSPYSDHGDAWMAIELVPGSLAGITGSVTYPPAFREV